MGNSMFNPESFSIGGGLLDDVVATVKEARIALFDYNGKAAVAVPAIKLTLAIEGEEDVEQFWSVGKNTDWMPSEDGKKLVAIGKATAIVQSSNGAIFLSSVVNAGFPADKITDDITFLEGLQAHWARVPAPKREGLVKTPRADGKEFEATILTIDKIVAMPWEKKVPQAPKAPATTGAPATAAPGAAVVTAAPPAAAAANGDIAEELQGIILAIVAEVGEVAKTKLPSLLLPKVTDASKRTPMVQLAFKDDFLSNIPGVAFAGGKLTLG